MKKKVDRMNKHMRTTSTPITSSSDQSDPASPSPRTLADKEIRLSGLTPRQVPKIRRRLLVANCIASELRQAGKLIKAAGKFAKCDSRENYKKVQSYQGGFYGNWT